jgi:DNA-binding NtrC family response regulator
MATRGPAVLYVDDEVGNLELFRLQFGRDFELRTATSAQDGLEILGRHDVGVVLTDERMPHMSGIELLARVLARWPDVTRIIVSAYSDPQRLLLAINRGHAHDYIVKPWARDDMKRLIEHGVARALRRRTLASRAELADVLVRDAAAPCEAASLIGATGGLQPVVATAMRAAQSDATVLVTGETGTGKELIAGLIHHASARAAAPLVRVNCAALAEGVIESELFGHEQGAFTGAVKRRLGRFELAHGGTIFLDEIGDVSPKLQAGLLRVLQEREIERVGGAAPIAVDVRVVAATHRDLRRRVHDGGFREDLYYRLNVLPIRIPPLRERPDDIVPLALHFLRKYDRGDGRARTIAPLLEHRLRRYAWPGNVRELENLIHRAVILAEGPELTVEDISFSIDLPGAAGGADSLRDQVRALEASSEAAQLTRALEAHGGNLSRAARALGVPRSTFISRARKHGLVP